MPNPLNTRKVMYNQARTGPLVMPSLKPTGKGEPSLSKRHVRKTRGENKEQGGFLLSF